jgi:hypothetical protein
MTKSEIKLEIKPLEINLDLNRLDFFGVDKEERDFAIQLPNDYIEFTNTYGEGIIGEYIRICPPVICFRKAIQCRENLTKNFIALFNTSSEKLTHELVYIGNTMGNDWIYYFNYSYYIYQSYDQEILTNVGSELKNVLDFFSSPTSGYENIVCDTFTPLNSFLTDIDY